MQINVYSFENSDGAICQEMHVDGENAISIYPLYECPEDAVIGRSLISCEDILTIANLLVEATKRGEEIKIEYINGDPDEIENP